MSPGMQQDPHFEEDDYRPWMFSSTRVPHYYGDSTRELLLAAAALILLGAPLYSNQITSQIPFIIIGAVVVVGAAAFTNPWSRFSITLDAITAGVGLTIFEAWSLSTFSLEEISFGFVLREAIAALFMFALYFSLKTLRAMYQRQVGKNDTSLDFRSAQTFDDLTDAEKAEVTLEEHEKMKEHNEEEKEEYRD